MVNTEEQEREWKCARLLGALAQTGMIPLPLLAKADLRWGNRLTSSVQGNLQSHMGKRQER